MTTPQVYIDIRKCPKGKKLIINSARDRGRYVIEVLDPATRRVSLRTNAGHQVFRFTGRLVGSAEISRPVESALFACIAPRHMLHIEQEFGGPMRLYVHTVESWTDATKSKPAASRRKMLQRA